MQPDQRERDRELTGSFLDWINDEIDKHSRDKRFLDQPDAGTRDTNTSKRIGVTIEIMNRLLDVVANIPKVLDVQLSRIQRSTIEEAISEAVDYSMALAEPPKLRCGQNILAIATYLQTLAASTEFAGSHSVNEVTQETRNALSQFTNGAGI